MLPGGVNAKLPAISNNRWFEINACAKCRHFPLGIQHPTDTATFFSSCMCEAELRFQFPVFAMLDKVLWTHLRDRDMLGGVLLVEIWTRSLECAIRSLRDKLRFQFPSRVAQWLHCWCEIFNLGCWHPWTKQIWVTTPEIKYFASAMCCLEGSTHNQQHYPRRKMKTQLPYTAWCEHYILCNSFF